MSRTESQHRRQIVEVGRWLHQKNFVAATDGNISARMQDGRVLVTPANTSKGMLRPQDMVLVDMQGNKISGRGNASSELPMHLLIYQRRPDVGGIVHAHPPAATGYAVAGLALDKAILPEVVVSLGRVPLARYATPGSPALNKALRNLVSQYDAILLANHGVVTLGKDLLWAFFHMETVEQFARISLVAKLLGRQALLSKQEAEKLRAARPQRQKSRKRPPSRDRKR